MLCLIKGNPDTLICGNCREYFTDLSELLEHKRSYCKLRFTCKCQENMQSKLQLHYFFIIHIFSIHNLSFYKKRRRKETNIAVMNNKIDIYFAETAMLSSSTKLLCALCKDYFISPWDLMVHVQAAHMINIYELGFDATNNNHINNNNNNNNKINNNNNNNNNIINSSNKINNINHIDGSVNKLNGSIDDKSENIDASDFAEETRIQLNSDNVSVFTEYWIISSIFSSVYFVFLILIFVIYFVFVFSQIFTKRPKEFKQMKQKRLLQFMQTCLQYHHFQLSISLIDLRQQHQTVHLVLKSVHHHQIKHNHVLWEHWAL